MRIRKLISSKRTIAGPLAGCLVPAFLLAAPAVFGASISLTADDGVGTSSFASAGNWSNASAPGSANDYFNANFLLRTPADANNYTFQGKSLTITSASALAADINDALIYKGTGSSTLTLSNLTFNGGALRQGVSESQTFTLAGNGVTVGSLGMGVHVQGPLVISAPVLGSGPIKIVDPGSANTGRTLTFASGANAYTGSIELVSATSSRFTLANGANLTFVPGASGVNNSVFGAGIVTFNGRFVFNLTGAATNLGSSWTVAGAGTQTFGSTFSVDGFTRQGFGTGPGVWNLSTNGANYEFNTASGVLAVVAAPSTNVPGSLPATSVKFEAVEADLLAGYAASYAAGVGGDDNAQVLIANAVAGNNAINDHSGTGARMKIVGYYQSANDVTGQTTTGGIVNWLANNDSHLSDVVAQGAALGADLVLYICNNSDSGSIAAVAQQPGMYSALNPGAVWSAVLAHETGGHNYGRSHADGFNANNNPTTVMLHNYCGGGSTPPYFYTNPKIWFKGLQLLGDGNNCNTGSLINGGDNSLPGGESTVGVADRRARVIVGPNLTHVVQRWLFTNAPASVPAGTTNLDLVSGAPAVVRGNGAVYTGGALRLPGGTTGNVDMNSMAAYIDLPNGIVSSQTNLTLEIWAAPQSAPSWARLFDFGRTTEAGDGVSGEWTGLPGAAAPGATSSSDDIMLSADVGTDLNAQRFEAKLNGTAVTLDSGLATTAGVSHHYAITFTDGAGVAGSQGGRWQWYRDGDPIAFLDVTNHLADIEDVNNWLGRSQWSGDQLANSDYAEVRISSVALSRAEVLANYLLGPNYQPTTTVALNASDASGSSSFNAAGQWSSGTAPNPANSYETFDFTLRTPATGSAYTFGGNTLKLSGGELLYKSTGSSSITVTNLILNGGAVHHGGSGTLTLAGNIAVTTNGAEFHAQNGAINITAPLSGGAPVTYLGNTVTLSGNNSAFNGRTFIGNGVAGTVAIDNEARLGPAPAGFTADHLALNRGTLVTTATMTLGDTNRGILLDVSGGTFNVAPGTTLTLAGTMSSPDIAANVVAGALTKTGTGTLVLSSPTNTFRGTLYVDSGSTTANDGVVKVVNNQVLASAHSPIYIRNNSGGGAGSTLQLDGSAGGVTLPQQISLFGRNSTIPAVQNLAGTNTISGGVSITVGGANYWFQSDTGLLNLGGTISSAATGTRTLTFLGNGGMNVSGTIADGGATVNVSKVGNGTLTLAGTSTYSGTTALSAGALLVHGAINSGAVTVSGGTLGGNGTITGSVDVQAGGTLAPGTSIGALTINGTLSLAGTTSMELSKTAGTNDVVRGLGSVNYGGVLNVTNLSGTLVGGEAFKLFSAASYNGVFAGITPASPGANLAWNTNTLATDGTLRVINTLAPSLAPAVAGGGLTLAWPQDHVGWHLETQTNSLVMGIGTNWMAVPGSSGTNQMFLPIDTVNGSVFFRLVYP
jgi:autotransporter-associated beta strand protein